MEVVVTEAEVTIIVKIGDKNPNMEERKIMKKRKRNIKESKRMMIEIIDEPNRENTYNFGRIKYYFLDNFEGNIKLFNKFEKIN